MSQEHRQQASHVSLSASEKLEQEARALARADKIAPGMQAGHPLLPRLLENGRLLANIRREFASAIRTRTSVPASTEWLLDNFYIVEQQLKQTRQDLSGAYYLELPKLQAGPLKGFPRIYHIAVALLAATDNRVTQDVLVRFVNAYQQVAPLSTGEVWAIPIMLRIVLTENLTRLMQQAFLELQTQRAANARAAELLAACSDSSTAFDTALEHLANDSLSHNASYLLQLALRLRDQDPAVAPALRWLEEQMRQAGTTLEGLIRVENQRGAVNRTSTGNVITTLRLLGSLDWHDFFENVSLIEHTLAGDPAGTYAVMDFATRDRYRHVVEALAQHNPAAEIRVAQAAVQLARRAGNDANSPATARHVGYFLIDEGLPALEAAVGYHPPFQEQLRRTCLHHATLLYLGSIGLVTLALVAGTVIFATPAGTATGMLILIALLALLPLSVLAIGAVNWTLSVELQPEPPPKLDLQNGIPPEYRTMIVIPALIVNQSGLQYLVEHLELRFLANRDDNLHLALLGDFADAPAEHMPEDAALLDAAVCQIRELNAKYGRSDAFFFLHRRRQWNPQENAWMGWERKRGKLEEFNHLLRGGETSYIVQEGETSLLPHIKYVITLDADTELPLQVARRLVGTIAHPLNRAVIDSKSKIVTRGYGIIQPRVDVVAPAAIRSRFAKLFAGDTGLDPYASLVSDVYQDLFQRAVYIGKAIYDVDVMERVLHGRFPENLLLSHDLLEGGMVRVGFSGEVELLEDFPSSYDTYAQRNHRWVRGDWQITSWLFPRVPDGSGASVENPLPLIERWKIFDNLRRSLVPFATIVWLLAAWTVLPGSPTAWTLLALVCVMFPFLRSALAAFGARPVGESQSSYLWALAQELWGSARRALVTLTMLLYQATLNGDAILRSLTRRAITRRQLLEWTSHAVAERRQRAGFGNYAARMWLASVLAVGIGILVALVAPGSLLTAAPLLILWFIAPTIAYSVSQPYEPVRRPLPDAARAELRGTARRIWRFYEEFAGVEDHWLPPDNYQVEPNAVVAHRTSPTNIGFMFLSTIAAFDFGYIQTAEFAERIERTLDTLDELERQRGHFFNWYDTNTLAPLHPRYISTVDSGNLASSLITLKQACLELAAAPYRSTRVWNGLADTLYVLAERLELDSDAKAIPMHREVERLQSEMTPWLVSAPGKAQENDMSAERETEFLGHVQARALYLARLAKRLDPTAPFTKEILIWCHALARQASAGQAASGARQPNPLLAKRLTALAQRADAFAAAMEFSFLYDPVRGVFSIGLNAETGHRDDSYYDLIASEARLTSFLAVARGEIPVKHWFRMSRPLTRIAGKAVLLSWSGTMFEYLMPSLLLRDFRPSLLQQTELAVIQAQITYAQGFKIPWGISESGFYAFDYQFNYQYRAFGVPGLSLKREFVESRVIAPYATFLALPHAPQTAWKNLMALKQLGGADGYGYYEALDFTPEHVPLGRRVAVVRSYMAHHQGMSLVALDNYFHSNVMQKRFHGEPTIAAAELLLQERVPRHAPLLEASKEERPLLRQPEGIHGPARREFFTPHTVAPRAHILSNGRYSVMVTNAGGGYSAWSGSNGIGENLVTRWQPDATLDALGWFCYIQDPDNGRIWSTAYQPTCAAAEDYHVTFAGDKIEFVRRDMGIETTTEIFVPPASDAEIRRITLTNLTTGPRTLDLTTYAEVVLENWRGDAAHPAFSKLFVESEFAASYNALLFKRRPRAADQSERWAFQMLLPDPSNVTPREYETDRARFLGRGRTLADPAALYGPLSNTTGATLDPIMSLRTRVQLGPNSSLTLTFVTGAATSRQAALAICDQFLDPRDLALAENAARDAYQVELRHLGITAAEANLFQRFASRVLFPDPQLRASGDVVSRNTQGQSRLWAYGISGDYPLVLLRVSPAESSNVVRQALLAHEFWRMRNLRVDLLIVDESATSYDGASSLAISGLIQTSLSHPYLDKPGGVFLRHRDQIAPEDYWLFETVARVILRSEAGNLADQLNLSGRHVPAVGARARRRAVLPIAATRNDDGSRTFFNGMGGFSPDGKEYVITLDEGQWTPLPWTNVIANPTFGCLVTEAGPGMAWAVNSQQNKLTAWSNDPVGDPPSQAVYLQDIQTGQVWSPTPLPIRETESYTIRHGNGYSLFEHTSHEIAQTLRVLVPPHDPVEILQLKLENRSAQARQLRATFYAEWVLGERRAEAQQFIVTERDAETNAIFARNVYNQEFQASIAFAAATEVVTGLTANRAEFLGRNGSYTLPAALAAFTRPLRGETGADLDPCAVLQVDIELPAGQATEIEFLLGQGENRTHARALIQKYSDRDNLAREIEDAYKQWDTLLNRVQVKTPDPALDVMLNRWLIYQTLACRFWGRAGFYQAGGAYGFRDQLQDVMALVYTAPELAREHLLRAAAHQFPEGDAQHWWHPPAGAGVRTRISDDYLWLPYVTAHYVTNTGDANILDEQIPFVTMPLLQPEQEEIYGKPEQSTETASLYEHCIRALDHSNAVGAHGLPLMGTGDWNDGMNRVGVLGKGESVWLGWFLYSNVIEFASVAERRGDPEHARTFRDRAGELHKALEEHAWDGAWYRRAFFDDGTPLGSQENAECRIDAIAQAWAIISGAASQERRTRALQAVEEFMVRESDRMILLLTPPFEHSQPNPGYIQGYVAGIRENGGQYTHGALWVALAYALQGDGKRAHELLQMLNPVNHGRTAQEVAQYKVEPYAIAADVYSHPQHRGRGGWTWYTGSAGWMYRIALEHMLGLQRRGNFFTMDPCIPPTWTEYEIVYQYQKTRYEIRVENPGGVSRGVHTIELDAKPVGASGIELAPDGGTRTVRVLMG